MSLTEDALNALSRDGFYCIHEVMVGESVAEMDRNGSQFSSSSKPGLDFYRVNVWQNEVIRNILDTLLQRCSLGYYQRIARDPGHIYQLYKADSPDVLLVQLWSKGSQAVYHPASHSIPIKSFRAANGMWEVPRAALKRAGVEGAEIEFENGGLVILDARLKFEINKGSPVTCAFAREEELRKWPRLLRPKSRDSDQIVAELESGPVSIYFEAQDITESGTG